MDAPLITFEKLQAVEKLSGEFSAQDYEKILLFSKSKDFGEHYTPSCLCELIAQIISSNNKEINSAYDPACGTGNLLLSIKAKKYFGQELNPISKKICVYNMSKANKESDIKLGDTLANPAHMDKKFDAVISNPPYSTQWTQINDERFFNAGALAPKSKSDLAFVLHSLYSLSDEGVAVIVIFPGVLYRGGAEQKIRKYLVENNFVDAIISLPEKLFATTQIAVNLLILRKNKSRKEIFFMDAKDFFTQKAKQNILSRENISQISDAYKNYKELEGISKLITQEKIKQEDFNLTVNNYIFKIETREKINIDELELKIWQDFLKNIERMFRWYEMTCEVRAFLGHEMNPLLPDLREKNLVLFESERMKITTR